MARPCTFTAILAGPSTQILLAVCVQYSTKAFDEKSSRSGAVHSISGNPSSTAANAPASKAGRIMARKRPTVGMKLRRKVNTPHRMGRSKPS